MTLTLTNQPTVEEVLSETAPELPDADLKEEHLTNYVGFFVQTKDKCDYYIGLGLIKAHEQWAGVQGSTKGRFRAWCAANTHLIKSNEEAYRLMKWAGSISAQNLRGDPEVIQQVDQVGLNVHVQNLDKSIEYKGCNVQNLDSAPEDKESHCAQCAR